MSGKSTKPKVAVFSRKIRLFVTLPPWPSCTMALHPSQQWRIQLQRWRMGQRPPLCDARSTETWKNEKESRLGHWKTHDSKATQNSVKPILAEIKPHLCHTVISPVLNKMLSYFHQIGISPIQERARESPKDFSWI